VKWRGLEKIIRWQALREHGIGRDSVNREAGRAAFFAHSFSKALAASGILPACNLPITLLTSGDSNEMCGGQFMRPLFLGILLLFSASAAFGQGAVAAPSQMDAAWAGLLKPAFEAGKSATAKNLSIDRDRIHLVLEDGTLQFTQPVNGVVFGAVFHGTGRLQMAPPNRMETQQLLLLTKHDGINLEFTDATLSCTDDTYAEIAAKVQWSATPPPGDDLYATRQQQREDLDLNLLPRIFKGVYSSARPRTAVFMADVRTRESGWVQATYDSMNPEEVSVGRWVDLISGQGKRFDTWMSFPAAGRTSADAFRDPVQGTDYTIRSYVIDAAVTAGADLTADTKVNFVTTLGGEKVLLFLLDSNMRVDKILDTHGQPLPFIQAREQKDRPQSYGDYVAVLLPAPTEQGRQETFEFHYGGKRAIRKVGAGNYFCESFGWYPARLELGLNTTLFTTRKDFDITFHSPKKFALVATGKKTSESFDGGTATSEWKSEQPLYVAGFAFGDYKVTTEKAGNVDVDIYANKDPDDFLGAVQIMNDPVFNGQKLNVPLGSLSPSALSATMSSEMANTIRMFEIYYGPYPYSHLAVTNIPYSYGQGWPGLIYLSALSFLDATQRHILGITMTVAESDFFRAHESSHQWWGHRVGWKSYHDQWLSEGFAEFSGNLYVQYRESPKDYLNLVHKALNDLKTKDMHGHVYDSVGPIWMGGRLSTSESPGGYDHLVYEKGGYVLHMIRQMLMDPRNKNPDQRFQEMMRDFTQTFDGKSASTEDFKAIVEKHMTQQMDLDDNHRMDWFFNQYVYGTGIPHYEFHYSTQEAGAGKWKVSAMLTVSGVPDGWKDMLPLYSHQSGGSARLGFLTIVDAGKPIEFVLPFNPEKLTVNDNLDVFADVSQ
jgi:Peptidase family M1 domain